LDEIAELRDALDRLHAGLDDLVVRGLRAAGQAELSRLARLRDEFRTAGAEHLAGRLSTLVDLARAGDPAASPALLRAMTALRLFDRMFTLEIAAMTLRQALPPGPDDAEEEGA